MSGHKTQVLYFTWFLCALRSGAGGGNRLLPDRWRLLADWLRANARRREGGARFLPEGLLSGLAHPARRDRQRPRLSLPVLPLPGPVASRQTLLSPALPPAEHWLSRSIHSGTARRRDEDPGQQRRANVQAFRLSCPMPQRSSSSDR